MENKTQNTKRSILVTNYRKKNDQDDPKKTIGDFFAFCGLIRVLDVQEEPEKKDYFRAYLTFDTTASAEVAQLLNTAVIGHDSEQIKVELIDTPAQHDAPAAPAPATAPAPAQAEPAVYTPAGVVERLLSLGYKLKDDTLHLAKQIDTTIRTTAVPTIVTAGNVIASHIPENIKEAGSNAYEVTAHTLQDASHLAKDITGNVLLNTAGLTEDIKKQGHAVADLTTATIVTATAATADALKNAGGVIASHVPQTVEGVKTVGQAIATTGQVTLDVTSHTLHEVADKTLHAAPVPVQQGIQTAADVTSNTLKTVGAAVSTTGHLAYDITENKLHQIANTTIESSQVAAATIASVYEANKAPILEAKNTAQATVSSIVGVGGETLKQTGQTAYNVASAVAAGASATLSGIFTTPATPAAPQK
eukprot:TRINITY_DN3145_c0_g1_i1.p1 TRINITY_DN3145_c0_g1~~TRINITY_DN3145_c0_g1_i1.p1  ORF type:complete len:419 (+),score=89.09 TRINITY_DN3145_c0_g1_i1:88-1344(+)